ncbi:Zinc finger C2H2-type [Arabidopsis suecica]|uniref:Zinc finger C2H2-type n=1 Tax=Arabidopsis suecica TaxID=45249 RepID=A0A8T2B299_ARASU|nr:Zinc finger C2H2-type [Arabidopsis suecica]
MEEHQEFEKPIFEFRPKKLRNSRVSRNLTKKTGFRESMNHYKELSCNYGLRENPKKTQKSLLDHRLCTRRRNKKSLIRCKECGKGFLYEKCLLNHRQVTHSEESMRRSLFRSFSVVQRRKRSKRVSRYKKILPRFSVSSSSCTMFPVSVDDGGLLEVAESLILLSMSGGKFLNALEFSGLALDWNSVVNLRKDGDFEDGFLSNEQKKLVGISRASAGTSKELSGYLADKKAREDDEPGQQKLVGAGILREETDNEQKKLVCQETAFEDSISGFEMNIEHRCGLCDKVFSTYQALGGHQTFHRMRNKSKSQPRDAEKNQ